MKIGIRKPSIKKSLKARTTGKIKRKVKRSVIPTYGKKGSGWAKNPKKAMYNKVYSKTSYGLSDLFVSSTRKNKKSNPRTQKKKLSNVISTDKVKIHSSPAKVQKVYSATEWKTATIFLTLVGIILLFLIPILGILFIIGSALLYYTEVKNNPYKTKAEVQAKEKKEAEKIKAISEFNISFEDYKKNSDLAEKVKTIDSFVKLFGLAFTDLQRAVEISELYRDDLYAKRDTLQLEIQRAKNKKKRLEKELVYKYFEENSQKALQLKTENGRHNNFQNGKIKLLSYKESFENSTLDLIEELYSSAI